MFCSHSTNSAYIIKYTLRKAVPGYNPGDLTNDKESGKKVEPCVMTHIYDLNCLSWGGKNLEFEASLGNPIGRKERRKGKSTLGGISILGFHVIRCLLTL